MNDRFHPAALDEYADAAEHYLGIRRRLGEEFVTEVERAVALICEYPTAWPVIEADARRYVLRRFPFAIYYRIVGTDTVFIAAVAHTSRQPGYWRHRLAEI